MREPRRQWVEQLRRLTGCEQDDIRWNEALGRWEFLLSGGDGVPRSQFWGWFHKPVDPVTGLHPFRELDDHGMLEALANLERTFVGNAFDGAGSTRKEVLRRMRYNKDQGRKRYQQAGADFVDMAAERGHRIRGAAWSGQGGTVAGQARAIHIERVIGGRKAS